MPPKVDLRVSKKVMNTKIEGAREVCIDLLQNHWMQWKANYEAMPEAERDEIYDHF